MTRDFYPDNPEELDYPLQQEALPEFEEVPADPAVYEDYQDALTDEELALLENEYYGQESENFEDRLISPELGHEITADDHAMSSAGLSHPEEEFYPQTEAVLPELPPEPAEEEPATTGSRRRERFNQKGRPKRRKGDTLFGLPQLAAALVWLAIILTIGLSLGRMIWVCASDVLAFGRVEKEVTISVTAEDDIDSIAAKLTEAGLIRYPGLFKIYADLSSAEEKITTGTFTLNTLYDYHALVNQMTSRSTNRVQLTVLIPEGYTCRQIFELLEEKGVCSVEELEEYAANGSLTDYWFLEGIPRGDKYCLEGFLFPDTYNFYQGGSAEHALEKMLSGFNKRFTEEMRLQIETLNQTITAMMQKNGESEEYIAQHQFTIRDLINVASLIEKETSGDEESFTIASVIYNRLFSWGDNPRYLNIDATVIYALEGKTDLTSQDMAVDSPYNTYLYTGLPPAPIANPGLASIKAALDPASSNYYYYVLDPEAGSHIFATTYEQHLKNIEKVT